MFQREQKRQSMRSRARKWHGRAKMHGAGMDKGESAMAQGNLDLVQGHLITNPLEVKLAAAIGDPALQSDTCSTCSLDYMHPYQSGMTDSEPTSPMLPIPFEEHTRFSTGSNRHDSGDCKPCAWYWKPGGCRNEAQCGYCHLCPVDEIKKRKRAKIIKMRHDRAQETFDSSDEHIEESSAMFQENKSRGDEIQTSNVAMEKTESQKTSTDHAIAGHQQSIIVKNTFIHVEFEDVPEASRVCETDHLMVSAGIIFTLFDWKHSVLPFE